MYRLNPQYFKVLRTFSPQKKKFKRNKGIFQVPTIIELTVKFKTVFV